MKREAPEQTHVSNRAKQSLLAPAAKHGPTTALQHVGDDTAFAERFSMPTLQNIVSTVNLNCPLTLKQIALHARNAEYNPRRFAAVIMRLREPKTTA